VLLDALISPHEPMRWIADAAADIPHYQIENISYWIKYYHLEYQSVKRVAFYRSSHFREWEYLMSPKYFEQVTDTEIQEIEKLIITANEEEVIGLSIAARRLDFLRQSNIQCWCEMVLEFASERKPTSLCSVDRRLN
jgi:hypothetical protein